MFARVCQLDSHAVRLPFFETVPTSDQHSPARHEEHLEPPDDTEDCDLMRSHASRSAIRITQL